MNITAPTMRMLEAAAKAALKGEKVAIIVDKKGDRLYLLNELKEIPTIRVFSLEEKMATIDWNNETVRFRTSRTVMRAFFDPAAVHRRYRPILALARRWDTP